MYIFHVSVVVPTPSIMLSELVFLISPSRMATRSPSWDITRVFEDLAGRFGSDYGGKMWRPTQQLMIPHADRILVCSEYLARNDLDSYGPSAQVVPCETWEEVLGQLSQSYPNNAKVAVYPYTAIQLPPAGT